MRIAIAALVTHPLLDGFTPYGTQLFAPFDRTRFAWNGVAIVDPFYTGLLGAGVLAVVLRRLSPRARWRGLVLGLTLSSAYLAVGLAIDRHVVGQLRETLERRLELAHGRAGPAERRTPARRRRSPGGGSIASWRTPILESR